MNFPMPLLSPSAIARERELIQRALLKVVGHLYLGLPPGAPEGFAYVRVSTPGQTGPDRTGLPRELLRLHELAVRLGLHIPFDHIRGDDFTGQEERRPFLDCTLAAMVEAPASARRLLIEHVDRLGRSYGVQSWIKREVERMGGTITYVKPMTAQEELFFGMFAEIEARTIGDRRRWRNTVKITAGELISFSPRYGYRIERSGGQRSLVTNEKTAKTVVLIHELFAENRSIAKVRSELHARGITAPRGGKVWSSATVYAILTDETYIGRHPQNRFQMKLLGGYTRHGRPRKKVSERPREEWRYMQVPAIVPEDLFIANQALLPNDDHARSGRPSKIKTMLRSIIKCECGRAMVHGKGNGAPFYYCPRHLGSELARHGKEQCPQRNIKVSDVDDLVWTQLAERLLRPEVFLAYLQEQHRSSGGSSRAELATTLEQADRAYRNVQRALDAYFEDGGTSVPAEIEASLSRLREKRDRAAADLEAHTDAPSLPTLRQLEAAIARFDRGAVAVETRHAIAVALIDEARLSSDGAKLELTGVLPLVLDGPQQQKPFSTPAGTASTPGDDERRLRRGGDRTPAARRPEGRADPRAARRSRASRWST